MSTNANWTYLWNPPWFVKRIVHFLVNKDKTCLALGMICKLPFFVGGKGKIVQIIQSIWNTFLLVVTWIIYCVSLEHLKWRGGVRHLKASKPTTCPRILIKLRGIFSPENESALQGAFSQPYKNPQPALPALSFSMSFSSYNLFHLCACIHQSSSSCGERAPAFMGKAGPANRLSRHRKVPLNCCYPCSWPKVVTVRCAFLYLQLQKAKYKNVMILLPTFFNCKQWHPNKREMQFVEKACSGKLF